MLGVVCRAAGGRRLVAGLLRSRRGTGRPSGARSSGHVEASYREAPKVARYQLFVAEGISGFMWFWVLWNIWHYTEEVLGHFPYPDPSQWTDEELGIPPDDEDM